MKNTSRALSARLLAILFLLSCASITVLAQQPANGIPKQTAAPKRQVYNDFADAKAEIAEVVAETHNDHKRILLVFGGNWCGDCLALDARFHEPPAQPIVEQNFHVVHISVGRFEQNLDVAAKYGIPIKKGVPAIAVLDPDGKLLYSQKNGEFESMRRVAPQDIVEFLNQWKPANK